MAIFDPIHYQGQYQHYRFIFFGGNVVLALNVGETNQLSRHAVSLYKNILIYSKHSLISSTFLQLKHNGVMG